MKIDIYHLFRHFDNVNFISPVILDVLKVWCNESGWDSRIRVARESSVDLKTDADVVAFSVYTQTAATAYRVARKLRDRGKIVILGGPHFRGPNYREALPHCDVVVNTINQEQWDDLLRDIECGDLTPGQAQARYIVDAEKRFRIPENLHTAFNEHPWYQVASLPTTIGCPYDCEFCNAFMQGDYIKRDLRVLYDEFVGIKSSTVLLSDASFGLHKAHTMELMNAIAPLKKTLIIETTLARLKDEELLESMARGGLKIVSIGVETLNLKLGKHGGVELTQILDRVIRKCHDLGILIQGNFIMGLDCDGPESFDRVFDYYSRSELDFVFTDILTPYPNTPLYYNMLKAGRILDHDWEHYDYRHVVYRPLQMSVNQLAAGFTGMYSRMTRNEFIWKKAKQILRHQGLSTVAIAAIAFNFFNRFDAALKERDFQETIKLIPAAIRDEILQPGENAEPRALIA